MQEEFEKNIKSKLSDFKIEPSSQVWLDVEDALQQSKKRRFADIWWFAIPVLFLLLGGGIWLINHTEITTSPKNTILVNKNNIISERPKLKTDSSLPENVGTHSVINGNRIKNNKPVTGKIIAGHHKEAQFNAQQKSRNQVNVSKDVTAEPVTSNEKINNKASLATSTSSDDKTTTPIQSKSNTIVLPDNNLLTSGNKIDSSKLNPPINKNPGNPSQLKASKATSTSDISFQGNLKQNDPILLTPNKEIKTEHQPIRKYKHQWFITAGVSLLGIKEGFGLFANNQNTYLSSPSSTLNGGTTSSTNNSISLTRNGYSFEAGILYSKSINKKWDASAGLQYRYLQNKQSVGTDSLAINSTQIYYSFILNNNTTTNYSHWLEFPVSLTYTFNSLSRYQLQVSGGGSIAWAFSENWLIIDKNNTSYPYHYNSALNNRFIANLHLGIGLNCNNKFKISLLAGQSLTPVHKNTTEKFYWQQFSFQISKPLYLSSHQNKKPKT